MGASYVDVADGQLERVLKALLRKKFSKLSEVVSYTRSDTSAGCGQRIWLYLANYYG